MLIINFIIQGLCKLLGFKKRYDILQMLGTTYLGDIYRICYNWPNIFKRILLDGTLDFVVIPYLLEGNAISKEEFNNRSMKLLNTVILGSIILSIIFWLLTPLITKSLIFHSNIQYYYRIYFLLIIPIGINIVFNEILQAQSYFIINNTGQIINNIVFIISIYFFKCHMLMGIWESLMMGFLVNNIYCLCFIIYKKYINYGFFKNRSHWSQWFLPGQVLIDMIKSSIFQIAHRFNHILANILGSRLIIPGILIGSDLIDNIINSFITIFMA